MTAGTFLCGERVALSGMLGDSALEFETEEKRRKLRQRQTREVGELVDVYGVGARKVVDDAQLFGNERTTVGVPIGTCADW